jgi:hypothetical protein
VINISNFICEDNPPPPGVQLPRLAPAGGAPALTAGTPARTAATPATAGPTAWTGARSRSSGARIRYLVLVSVDVLLSWPTDWLRRLGGRLFAANDTEAYWRGWQITTVHAGLGRRYRDLRFGALAECVKCQGSGLDADAPCLPCLGTGRVTIGEVS